MSADELALFGNVCSKPVGERLSQCATADATTLASLNASATMVDFLRGQPKSGYRPRDALLGDLVNSSPVFVGAPGFKYIESGYAEWAADPARAGRQRVLLVGGNDGMLHAFKDADDETGGTELWAYVPRLVMDQMYRLADMNYASSHRYFVEGTPVVSDIVGDDGSWRTIVVAGLNGGGRGYYALDITDPTAPKALWEFGPANLPAGEGGRLGYTYGNPIVTKTKDGTWIVAFTSGYNNPDGGGYLFIVNANTGALITTLSTGVGDASNPSGLSRINAWIESQEENLALRFYGGDLTGRLYRFDPDKRLGHTSDVVELAQFNDKGAAGASKAQPITTIPMLAEFAANGGVRKVIYVGTGKYLGASDVPATSDDGDQQAIYGVVDTLAASGHGDIRAGDGLIKQPVDTSVTPRKVGSKDTPVDWSKDKGWYVNLVSKAERVNVDMLLAANTLVAVGNVPGKTSSDCAAPGSNTGWMYLFNIISGSGTSTTLGSMVAGLGVIEIATTGDSGSGTPGGTKLKGVVTTTAGDIVTPDIEPMTSSSGAARRSAWRELR
jgi:type IV pilus assembly protein PilY1